MNDEVLSIGFYYRSWKLIVFNLDSNVLIVKWLCTTKWNVYLVITNAYEVLIVCIWHYNF